MRRIAFAVVLGALCCRPVAAQQRPLTTEDPETIGAGRILVEGGVDFAHGQSYPVTGLKGNLWRIPALGLSIGISSIAEIQVDGGPFNRLSISERQEAALADVLQLTSDHTSDVEDIVIGMKIRLAPEAARRPSVGFRFATRLPNAAIQKGLGAGTTDFVASLLAAKTVQSIRVVGNVGFGILGDPTLGHRQNDVLTYGASFARADRSGRACGRIERTRVHPGR